MAEENASLSNNDRSPLGEMWRYGCPKKLLGKGTSVAGHTTLKVSTGEVTGENWSLFLEDWELARVALSCLRPAVPGNANVPGEPTVTVYGSLSHLGRAVTARIGVR